jgi:hypothetical protein
MTSGELITRWSIRIALLLCAAALGLRLRSYRAADAEGIPQRTARLACLARLLWTLAFASYLVHLAAAFSFYHAWSHRAAWQHTALRTNEVLGIDWGGGVWFNYLFTLAWAADVAWLWSRPAAGAKRPRWVICLWYAWFGAIVFFATVVFETGATRWVAVAILALLGAMALQRNAISPDNSS